jgi:hypothetical protein
MAFKKIKTISKTFNTFLKTNTDKKASMTDFGFFQNLLNLKQSSFDTKKTSLTLVNQLTNLNSSPNTAQNLVSTYPQFSLLLNNNSDKAFLHYPLRKLFNSQL